MHAVGNSIASLDAAFEQARAESGSPTVILAETVKGCGVSFMENQAGWHHRVPTAEEYEAAVRELSERAAKLREGEAVDE